MAEDLFEELGKRLETIVLVPGREGSFEVEANGTMIFSKFREHRFPESSEILAAINS